MCRYIYIREYIALCGDLVTLPPRIPHEVHCLIITCRGKPLFHPAKLKFDVWLRLWEINLRTDNSRYGVFIREPLGSGPWGLGVTMGHVVAFTEPCCFLVGSDCGVEETFPVSQILTVCENASSRAPAPRLVRASNRRRYSSMFERWCFANTCVLRSLESLPNLNLSSRM